jgi:hypothetical protein
MIDCGCPVTSNSFMMALREAMIDFIFQEEKML